MSRPRANRYNDGWWSGDPVDFTPRLRCDPRLDKNDATLLDTGPKTMRSLIFGVLACCLASSATLAADDSDREIPDAFAPFEHMIGAWKGTAVPAANRLRGWQEKHLWAWKFDKGRAVGMTVALEGDKTLASGKLGFDPESSTYRLDAVDASKKPHVYTGKLTKVGRGHVLTLEAEGSAATGKERLILRPNTNLIRYTMEFEVREPGAPQFRKVTEVGLTKEGESFAAGSSAADLPKCVITGGSATMTVSYEGKTYPICCTGCRDEFNENPAKYVKKALLRAQAEGAKPVKAASRSNSNANAGDDAFAGIDDAPATKSKPAYGAKKSAGAGKSDASMPGKSKRNGASATSPKAAAAKAASLLRSGRNLEKAGNNAAALKYYKQIVQDYPDSAEAKSAQARIDALSGE